MAVMVIVLLTVAIVFNRVYAQEGVDPISGSPMMPTYVHGDYHGVAGLYETPWPARAVMGNPPYSVNRTGKLNILCQVSDGTVMEAVLVNAVGVERKVDNDIWYRVALGYYIPAVYTTFPYGVERFLLPGEPFGTEINECADRPLG